MPTRLASPVAAARWLRAGVTGCLRTDSRRVRPGDGFIAWPGHAVDGRRFVAAALEAGATSVLVEEEGVDVYGFSDTRIGTLAQLKAATGWVADAYFEHPSQQLRVVATTGTNGKTSTAWWTAQALTLLGRRCGLVGTLGVGEPPRADGAAADGLETTGLTTPDPVTLQASLRRMADAGFAACAIEASSIGLAEHRLAATRIAVALFTNFTRDHLDFHGSMAEYWAAKRALFDWAGLEAAVINRDDPQGATLATELADAERGLALWTYSLHERGARLCAGPLDHTDGLAFSVRESGQVAEVRSRLVGDYNAANLLAVIGALRALGLPLGDAARAVSRLAPVPGRLQRVGLDDSVDAVAAPGALSAQVLFEPEVVVDYAHTPDALEKTLGALRAPAQARGGRLVCVFGCGGNRDASKRPLMAAAAERLADAVVVTDDNPRHEDPGAIRADILAGFARPQAVQVIPDRRRAITESVLAAGARDLLLIAGKGHEDYQEIAGARQPFSDVDEARRALSLRVAARRPQAASSQGAEAVRLPDADSGAGT